MTPLPQDRPTAAAINRRDPVIGHDGLMVGPIHTGVSLRYAEVTPAYARWLLWPGRTSRWWYEIHEIREPDDEYGVDAWTLAYIDGGSGGGFTLASCIRKAARAIDELPVAGGDDDGTSSQEVRSGHGRHCPCSACAREHWLKLDAPCGIPRCVERGERAFSSWCAEAFFAGWDAGRNDGIDSTLEAVRGR